MTRNEAISYLSQIYVNTYSERYRDALGVALFALRSPTREQMEKVWRGEWEMVAESAWGKQYKCSKCRTRNSAYSHFCPACGAPMTDEAVEMVMERLEALKDADD